MPDPQQLPPGVSRSGQTNYKYRLPYKDTDGKWRQEVRGGFQTWEAAWLARTKRAVELGQQPASALPDNRTVDQYFTAWLDAHRVTARLRDSTFYNYRATYRRDVQPHLGDVRLRDLTVERVRTWVTHLTRTKSAASAKEARRLLVQMLHQATADELVTRNVAAIVRPPRHTSKETAYLEPDEIVRFLAVADQDEHCALWYLGLMVQARPGELTALRWSDVDLDHATLTIAITRTRSESGKFILGDDVKRRASRRTIELPATCVQKLREHRRRQAEMLLRMPHGIWHDNGLVFPNRTGKVMGNSTLQYRLRAICREAGVTVITPAGLRHSGITWLRRLGEDIEVISRRVGHTRVEMTMARYRHVSSSEQREASARLDQAVRDMRSG